MNMERSSHISIVFIIMTESILEINSINIFNIIFKYPKSLSSRKRKPMGLFNMVKHLHISTVFIIMKVLILEWKSMNVSNAVKLLCFGNLRSITTQTQIMQMTRIYYSPAAAEPNVWPVKHQPPHHEPEYYRPLKFENQKLLCQYISPPIRIWG